MVFIFRVHAFQQYKKYDKNSTTKNWQSAKQYKKYDNTFVYLRVSWQPHEHNPQIIIMLKTKNMKLKIVTTLLIMLPFLNIMAQSENDGMLITQARLAIEKYKDFNEGINILKKVSVNGQKEPFYALYMAKAYEGLNDDRNQLKYLEEYTKLSTMTPELMEKIADLKYRFNKKNEENLNLLYNHYCNQYSGSFGDNNVNDGIDYLNKAIETGKYNSRDLWGLVSAYAYIDDKERFMVAVKNFLNAENYLVKPSIDDILDYYSVAKYYNKPFFVEFIKSYPNADKHLSHIKENINCIRKRTGIYVPNQTTLAGGKISKIIGSLAVSFNDDLEMEIKGSFDYKISDYSKLKVSAQVDKVEYRSKRFTNTFGKVEYPITIYTKIEEYLSLGFHVGGEIHFEGDYECDQWANFEEDKDENGNEYFYFAYCRFKKQ